MRPIVIGLLLALLAGGPGRPSAQAQGSETYVVECTLSNPSYSGNCVVTEETSRAVSPQKACEAVLSCLNDPRCTKTYCSATTIRQGWKLEEAGEKKE